VTDALEGCDTLMGLTNDDRDGLDWPGATQMTIDGTAGYNVMGDWALAAFNDADMKRGEGFVDFPVPGTDGTFDFLADSFTMPVDVPHPDGSKAWLERSEERRVGKECTSRAWRARERENNSVS